MEKERELQDKISEFMKLYEITPSRFYELLAEMEEFYEDRAEYEYSEDF